MTGVPHPNAKDEAGRTKVETKPSGFTPLQRRTLQVAKRFLGQKEATGRNDGWVAELHQRWLDPLLTWLKNAPWCVLFALRCVHVAAGELGVKSRLPKLASSSQLYRWYKKNGLLLEKPVPGCIGMVRGGPTGRSHTFLVHDVQGDDVVGVDGNWKNSVRWTRRRVGAGDFGRIV